MRVIKRSGSEVEFDITKIIAAVNKANATVSDDKKLTKEQITELVQLTVLSINKQESFVLFDLII